jgi:hypothetical protein
MKGCIEMVQEGVPSARLVRRLVYTTPPPPESGRYTGYMVHLPGGMFEVGVQSKHQLRIAFWSFRHVVKCFRQQLLFEMTLLMLRGSVLPSRHNLEGCMKVMTVEKSFHTYPLDASTSPGLFGMDHRAYTVDHATLETRSVH